MSLSGEPPRRNGQGRDQKNSGGGNKKRDLARVVAEKIEKLPTPMIPQPRNDAEFTYGGSSIEKTVISTQTALEAAVEQQIDIHLGGLDLLLQRTT